MIVPGKEIWRHICQKKKSVNTLTVYIYVLNHEVKHEKQCMIQIISPHKGKEYQAQISLLKELA